MSTAHALAPRPRPGRCLRRAEFGKRSLIALSHAMEDRAVGDDGPPPLVFGSFQRARFSDHDRARYARIAAPGPVIVARDHAAHAIDDLPTRDRLCDAVWSYDPRLTHAAARWWARTCGDTTTPSPRTGTRRSPRCRRPPPGPDRALTALGGHLVGAMQREIARQQAAGRRPGASYEATIAALARAAEARDPLTDEHLARVARRAVAVGRTLVMDAPSLEALRQGARLHDVGKISVPDAMTADRPRPPGHAPRRRARAHRRRPRQPVLPVDGRRLPHGPDAGGAGAPRPRAVAA